MRSVIRMSNIAFATLLLGLLVFASQSVQAAPTVINTADAGTGSLRQAILDATAGSTIDFAIPTSDPGFDLATNRFTITLASSLPVISVVLTIDNFPTTAPGVTVKGNNTFRIFTLANSAVVTINNLTISHGSSNGTLLAGTGGGIFMGNSAVLTLNNCIVSDNTATNGGGGIWMNNSGVLHIFDSTISNNSTTTENGGGIRIFDSGTLNITRSTVSGNHADGATAPAGGGGGIYNGVTGTVNMTNSTVNGNTAGNLGGGINNGAVTATMTVNSSTISSNSATIGGGGIFNGFTATLANALVALNTSPDGPDLKGSFTANSCLVRNADGSLISGANNQLGTTAVPIDPLLDGLRDNGGPTFTRALLPGSPAIDTGASSPTLSTDQRGIARPQNGDGVGGAQDDIGSYERRFDEPTPTPTPTPSPTPSPTPTTPTFRFDLSVYATEESCTSIIGHVLRDGPTTTSVSVDVTSSDGSAKQKGDYNIVLAHLVFAAGDTDKTFEILINDDGYTEGLEIATLLLQNPTGGVLGIPSAAGLEITDNSPETSSNPIDFSRPFVCQHYHDFLYRQSDTSGEDFWTNSIEQCGTDTVCRQNKRVDVSTAFFLSIEFQQTGYFVIRAYKAAFGSLASNPRYTVFLRDQHQITNGVIVGQGNWAADLETNKQNYLSDFVSRPEFVVQFPLGSAAATYVDSLFLNAGATPTTAERNAAIAAYGSGDTSGRVAALKSVIQSGSLFNAQYNPAFVLMQYYGYLRRNPDDSPDNNFSGYDFWLNKMNSFTLPGEDARNPDVALLRVRRAEMVKAFIVSGEFLRRFFGAAGGNQEGPVEVAGFGP